MGKPWKPWALWWGCEIVSHRVEIVWQLLKELNSEPPRKILAFHSTYFPKAPKTRTKQTPAHQRSEQHHHNGREVQAPCHQRVDGRTRGSVRGSSSFILRGYCTEQVSLQNILPSEMSQRKKHTQLIHVNYQTHRHRKHVGESTRAGVRSAALPAHGAEFISVCALEHS